MKKLILIKFGGSLITDKSKIDTAKFNVIDDLSKQIKEIINQNKNLSIIIATGAGGFGHPVAKKYKNNLERGLPEIKKAVKKINQIVVSSLVNIGLDAVSVEPSKIARYKDGKIISLLYDDIISLLNKNTIPVFHADLVNDETLGISILSMDKFLVDMAIYLLPAGRQVKNHSYEVEKVIFCGTTNGVLDSQGKTIKEINKININQYKNIFYDNKTIDTSGGMKGKVRECLRLIENKISCSIINGQLLSESWQLDVIPSASVWHDNSKNISR